MLESLIKITQSGSDEREMEIFSGLKSSRWIQVEVVTEENFPQFLQDLESFASKLDDAIGNFYRLGSGP